MNSGASLELEPLIELRRALHAHPELSGREAGTAERVRAWIEPHGPDEILSGLGGHGLAAIYEGAEAGPTVLLRADLDAMPIGERSGAAYCSQVEGVSHVCGHDGHMAMLASLAPWLAGKRAGRAAGRGRVVLLFQPAEETGEGARGVIEDARFARIRPDFAFGLHNLPGRPMGQVVVRAGTFAMGSVGMIVRLRGRTSHSAEPEKGLSPGGAVARLIEELPRLGDGGARLATVAHARLGEASFGVSPGEGVVLATLRADSAEGLRGLREEASALTQDAARDHGLGVAIEWVEEFSTTVNDGACARAVAESAAAAGLEVAELEAPMRWSEDFGRFLEACPGALFGLGSGEAQPPLHASDYDFPDALIPYGARAWRGIVERMTGA